MTISRIFWLGVAAAALMHPAIAAADVTPADADKLKAQLTDWVTAVLGPDPKRPTPLFDVLAQGDHFIISDPGASTDHAGAAGRPTPRPGVTVKQLDATRWAILSVYAPANVPAAGAGSGLTDAPAPSVVEASGVLDPTLATPSSLDATFHIPADFLAGKPGASRSEVSSATLHIAWTAATEGRVALQSVLALNDMKVSERATDGTMDVTTVDRFVTHTSVDGLLFPAAGDLLRSLVALGEAHAADAPKQPPQAAGSPAVPLEDRPAAHALLSAVRNLATGFQQDVVVTNLHSGDDGHRGGVKMLSSSLGASAAHGELVLHAATVVDGFDSDEIPPGVIHGYLPRHVAFKPSLTGLPIAALCDMVDLWIDQGDRDEAQMLLIASGLLAKGSLTLGIDELAFDVGPGQFSASGALTVVAPLAASAQAVARLTGADAMLADADAEPDLKQAAPVLIFLKGLAKQSGDALVWDIGWKDKKLLVNGIDMSSMLPK